MKEIGNQKLKEMAGRGWAVIPKNNTKYRYVRIRKATGNQHKIVLPTQLVEELGLQGRIEIMRNGNRFAILKGGARTLSKYSQTTQYTTSVSNTFSVHSTVEATIVECSPGYLMFEVEPEFLAT